MFIRNPSEILRRQNAQRDVFGIVNPEQLQLARRTTTSDWGNDQPQLLQKCNAELRLVCRLRAEAAIGDFTAPGVAHTYKVLEP